MTAATRSAADTGYTVMVWNVNLLTRLGRSGHPAGEMQPAAAM